MNYTSKKDQIKIYMGKFFREFKNMSKLSILLGAIATPIIIRLVTGLSGFLNGDDSRTGAFILMCSCLWLGLFNSITNICKEREIIRHEYREGLDIKSYITSHMIFQCFVTLIESVIITILMTALYFKNFSNILLIIPLFIAIFLIIYTADTLGILLSSIVRSVSEAMTVMPFVLLIQLVLAGNIVLKNSLLQVLSRVSISKNGYDGILRLSDVTSRTGSSIISEILGLNFDKVTPYPLAILILIAMSIAFGYLASQFLERNINKN